MNNLRTAILILLLLFLALPASAEVAKVTTESATHERALEVHRVSRQIPGGCGIARWAGGVLMLQPMPVIDRFGSCDSIAECKAKTKRMCEDAGHGTINEQTVNVTLHADGSATCSADCTNNGAVAMVTCNP